MPVGVLLTALMIGILAACGNDPPKTSTQVNGRRVFVINDLAPECDDSGSCAALWTIDGREYELGCRPDLTGRKLALYAVAGRNVPRGYEAWTVEGEEPAVALLVPQGQPCLPGPTPRYLVAK